MQTVRVALPKQERLRNRVLPILEEAGFEVESFSGLDLGEIRDKTGSMRPLVAEFARASDAQLLLDRDVVDLAIIGSDTVTEARLSALQSGNTPAAARLMTQFNAATCRMCLAVPKDMEEETRQTRGQNLNGLRIATSFPATVKDYLTKSGIEPAEIVELDGGVEMSIRRGIADVVVDLVETGGTLKKNGLVVVNDIARSSAALYRQDKPFNAAVEANVQQFASRLTDAERRILARQETGSEQVSQFRVPAYA